MPRCWAQAATQRWAQISPEASASCANSSGRTGRQPARQNNARVPRHPATGAGMGVLLVAPQT
eukprot:11157918-Lingulodinium_polyedra.AAC.1